MRKRSISSVRARQVASCSRRLTIGLLAALVLVIPGISHCASPREGTPTIVLDPGTHTGPIRRLASDQAQTILVTVSDDKSARLWNLRSRQLLGTLHPPIGPGPLGRLYGAAVSSDNRVALAGTTAAKGGLHLIYFFDLLSHSVVGSFDARGGNIKRLEFSPDGELLAAAYADSPAVRVFNRHGELVYEEALRGDAYYLAFSSLGQMAVSVSDGTIHLYATSGQRVTAAGTISTIVSDPRGVSFSPDGRLLAVGYLSRTVSGRVRVDVFEAETRRLAKAIEFTDIDRGNLMNVAWQSDGHALYAAGSGYRDRNRFIAKRISWPEGVAVDIDVGHDSVLDLMSLRNGTVVFATAEPSWGAIRGDRVVGIVPTPTNRFTEASALRTSENSRVVSWGNEPGGKPVHFNLETRRIDDGMGHVRQPPEPSTRETVIAKWENNYEPTINGGRVALEPSEISRAVATLPDGVLLGTSRALRAFDADGRQRWARFLPTETRSVVLSADRTLAVTAMLDGTIRWWRVSDGILLMSFFATTDRRWVLWTEHGYFDVSAGGEDLIGWVVNRPEGDRTDYYPISRFRERYLRPDVVDRILVDRDPDLALAHANEARRAIVASESAEARERLEKRIAIARPENALPPTVSLVTPADVELIDSTISIGYTLSSDGPVSSIMVRINGHLQDTTTEPIPPTDGKSVGKLLLTTPEDHGTVQIIATNQYGASPPATVHFNIVSKTAAGIGTPHASRLYLLSIGIGRYANSKFDLPTAADDAKEMTLALGRQEAQGNQQIVAKLLLDEHATRAEILKAMNWLATTPAQQDVAMLYLAGRAVADATDSYQFLPHDADPGNLRDTAISEEELGTSLGATKGKAILLLDTCHSTGSRGSRVKLDLSRLANKFSSPEFGAVVLAACDRRGVANTDKGSPFAAAVVEGLSGKADERHRGYVTYSDLGDFVGRTVKKTTSGLQSPLTTAPAGLPDFALVRLHEGKS